MGNAHPTVNYINDRKPALSINQANSLPKKTESTYSSDSGGYKPEQSPPLEITSPPGYTLEASSPLKINSSPGYRSE